MKSVKYLLDLQESKGMNDAQLARFLNLTAPAVSQYKSGKRVMDDETCLAVALALEVDPLRVVGAACIDRAEKSGQHSLWEVFMSRMAAPASALLTVAAVNLFLTPSSAEAAPLRAVSEASTSNALYYVKWLARVRRTLRAKLAGFKRMAVSATLLPATP